MSETESRIELRAALLTDVGMVRDHNEDCSYIDPDHRFFIVADGMGGHAAGEVASAMAVDAVRQFLTDHNEPLEAFANNATDEGRKEAVGLLEQAVRNAHQSVYDRGVAESDKQGMGTTLDVLVVAGPEAFIAHVGDSRTYLIRGGKAAQITTDHTVAEVLVIEGKLSLEEAQISPLRTILVNAIGVAPDIGVEMAHVQLRTGDLLLLCSDGLHDYFPQEEELALHLVENDPQAALQKLIDLAKDRGGHDNITGVVIEVMKCESGASDGLVQSTRELELSNGVPDKIERDDTMPVDVTDDSQVLATLTGNDALADTPNNVDEPASKRVTEPMEAVDGSEVDEDTNEMPKVEAGGDGDESPAKKLAKAATEDPDAPFDDTLDGENPDSPEAFDDTLDPTKKIKPPQLDDDADSGDDDGKDSQDN